MSLQVTNEWGNMAAQLGIGNFDETRRVRGNTCLAQKVREHRGHDDWGSIKKQEAALKYGSFGAGDDLITPAKGGDGALDKNKNQR